MAAAVQPYPVQPGRPLHIAVRGLPAGADTVWCRAGKLHRGFDTAYLLTCHAPGAWSAWLPVAQHATAGAIRAFLYVRVDDAIERHDLTAGAVGTVPVTPQPPDPSPHRDAVPDNPSSRKGGDTTMAETKTPPAEPYAAPRLVQVGDLASLTQGTAYPKGSDDNDGSSYYDSKFTAEVR